MNIEETARRITELKEREDAAKNERTVLENDLAAAIATKEEGTESRTAGSYKVTVTSKLTSAPSENLPLNDPTKAPCSTRSMANPPSAMM